jgi:hypothetical protein
MPWVPRFCGQLGYIRLIRLGSITARYAGLLSTSVTKQDPRHAPAKRGGGGIVRRSNTFNGVTVERPASDIRNRSLPNI